MLDIAEELSRWVEEARSFAVATFVAASGSGPGAPCAALAVDAEGTVIGSLPDGCVDGAIHELCHKVMFSGEPVVERFDCSDEIDTLVTPILAGTPLGAVFRSALLATARGEPAVLARVVRGPADKLGTTLLVRPDCSYEGGLGGPPELDQAAAAEAHALLEAGRSGTLDLSASAARWESPRTESAGGSLSPGSLTLLVESNASPPRMIVL